MLDPEEKDDALNMLSAASAKLDGLSGIVVAWVDDKEGVLTFHRSGKNVVLLGMLTMILDDVKQGVAGWSPYNPKEDE